MNETESTRTAFGKGLISLAERNERIIAVAADNSRSMNLGPFCQKFPKRFFEFGIAEQNMVMAAAGMASEGKIVFVITYSTFCSMRALEQVRTFVAYPQLNVKFAAGLGGLSGDTDGVTHQATEDISIIRSIPHLKLIVPADATAAKKFVNLMAKIDGPIFMRLGRGEDPIIYKHNQKFKIGKSILVKDFGNDLTIIAVGRCVAEAIYAANKLLTKGIKTRVIDMHTIKPIDRDRIIQEAKDTGFIVSVEDGNICGGLGSAIAEVIAEEGITYKGNAILFKRLGLVETFGTSGKLEELLDWYHISSDHIVSLIEKIITKK